MNGKIVIELCKEENQIISPSTFKRILVLSNYQPFLLFGFSFPIF